MRVLRLHGLGDLRLHQEPDPAPKEGEVLIKVNAVGLCGSDLHWFAEAGIGDARLTQPLVLGHEFAGEIIEGDRRGEIVAVDPAIPCGRCEFCREGNPNFCENLYFAGHGLNDGALREKIAWPSANLYSLPENISAIEGVMLEPLGVAIHALDLSHMRMGMSVGVYGCGPIGLLIIQLARLMGASLILATEKLDHRLEAAERLGASEVYRAKDGQEAEAILSKTNGRGVDVAFEVSTESEAVQSAIACARSGARVVLVGIPDDDRTAFQASVARRKGLTIMLCRRMKHTYPRAIRLVAKGLVDVGSLVSHRFSLDEHQQAFDFASHRKGLKIVIEP